MTKKNFVEECIGHGIPAHLTQAVIAQFGDWEMFEESAQDMARNGASGGYGGFIYYHETKKFFQENKDDIMAYSEQLADDLRMDMFAMFQGFGRIKKLKCSVTDIAKAIYQDSGEDCDEIQNVLTWFAAESVCQVYDDLKYEEDEE